MQLFAPEILMEGHGLSIGLSALGLLVGVALWVTGWLGHRFWIVMTATLTAGVIGLATSSLHGMKPMLAGVLLAVAAGLLALALVRLVMFAAAGAALSLAFHHLAPPSLDEPLGWFLVGGLVGLLMFRFWTMVLTSTTGALVAGYSLLLALDTAGKVDAVHLSETRPTVLSAACLGCAAVGVVLQILIERKRIKLRQMKEELDRQLREREEEALYGRRRWLPWGQKGPPYREAS